MLNYHNYIGIDIGKFNFVVAIHGIKGSKEYENSSSGHSKFIEDNQNLLKNSLCILETTGGQELALLLLLCEKGFAVHRANTRKVKNFIRSFGNTAKTDNLDAKALALYGFERGNGLSLFVPPSENAIELYELTQRRRDVLQMLVAEKNRLQAPRTTFVHESIEKFLLFLEEEITALTNSISEIISSNEDLQARKEALKEIPGIGEVTSNNIIVLIPELGTISHKQVASLAGLAPRSNDSGTYSGYRSTGYGRGGIKPMLFLAAMAARRSHTHFKDYYESLILRGKKKMVALVALMRKILVTANARIRDLLRKRAITLAKT